VHWSDNLGLWIYSKRIPEKNHWNVLGIGQAGTEGRVVITCEINFRSGESTGKSAVHWPGTRKG
jgi:hypothetical protein